MLKWSFSKVLPLHNCFLNIILKCIIAIEEDKIVLPIMHTVRRTFIIEVEADAPESGVLMKLS